MGTEEVNVAIRNYMEQVKMFVIKQKIHVIFFFFIIKSMPYRSTVFNNGSLDNKEVTLNFYAIYMKKDRSRKIHILIIYSLN